MLTTAQHKPTSAIIGAERAEVCAEMAHFNQISNILNLSCKLQKRTAAGEDPKPHSKTLADERTCWTKASHWSESQRIHPCFSGWTSNVLGKKSSSTSKLSANTASWTTVVDALWAMFQYQILPNKEPHVPFCRALRFIQITTLRGMLGHAGQQRLC